MSIERITRLKSGCLVSALLVGTEVIYGMKRLAGDTNFRNKIRIACFRYENLKQRTLDSDKLPYLTIIFDKPR